MKLLKENVSNQEALEKSTKTYRRFESAAKYIDPRKE